MNRQRKGLTALLAMALVGCGAAVDIEAEREALLETDRAWVEAASRGDDVDRIVSYWTDDAKWWAPGQPLVHGKAAIREMVAAMMEIPGFSVSWEALEAEVAAAGDMAYTAGRNRFTAPGEDGELATVEGRYLAVWRKEADGSWRQAVGLYHD